MAGSNDNGGNGKPSNGTGRGKNGQFVKGWKGGPGNLHAVKTAAFRRLIFDATTEEDLKLVWKQLLTQAKCGNQWAIKELLDRLLGKAKQTVELQADSTYTDPFPILSDPEVTGAFDRALARRAVSDALGEPGSLSN